MCCSMCSFEPIVYVSVLVQPVIAISVVRTIATKPRTIAFTPMPASDFREIEKLDLLKETQADRVD